jgi:nitroreductase
VEDIAVQVNEAIASRLSIRRYADISVPAEHMKILFKALQLAPSANNRQNWEFVLAGDPNLKRRLAAACFNQRFVSDCAYFIAAVADPELRWHMVDITIALTNFTLQATELGYGTCWIGAFEERTVKKLLNIPPGKKVVICMAFGKPAVNHIPRSRKAIADFIYADSYGSPWKG